MKPFKVQSSAGGKDILEDFGDLAEVLGEFDAVIEDFSSPINKHHFQYEEHLERMKRRSSASVSDYSGISDSESADSLCRNSFSFSDEKLNSAVPSTPTVSAPKTASQKAKLGDTKELEDFIADLDKTLATSKETGLKSGTGVHDSITLILSYLMFIQIANAKTAA